MCNILSVQLTQMTRMKVIMKVRQKSITLENMIDAGGPLGLNVYVTNHSTRDLVIII